MQFIINDPNFYISESIPVATGIAIYNNNSYNTDAYLSIDYKNNSSSSFYLKYNSNFTGYSSALTINNDPSSVYKLNKGIFKGTKLESGSVILDGLTYSGSYITPIVKFNDPYLSTNLFVNTYLPSGTSIDSIECRSSDVEPYLTKFLFWAPSTKLDLNKYIYNAISLNNNARFLKINKKIGVLYATCSDNYVRSYDLTGTSLISSSGNANYYFKKRMEVDNGGNVWGLGATGHLIKLSRTMNLLVDLYYGNNSVVEFALDKRSNNVCYINGNDGKITLIDELGNELNSTYLSHPTALCYSVNNSLAVVDKIDKLIYILDSNLNELYTIEFSEDYSIGLIVSDDEGGFWYYVPGYIVHINNKGIILDRKQIHGVTHMDFIDKHLVVYDSNNYVAYIFDTNGELIFNKIVADQCMPTLYILNFEEQIINLNTTIPKNYDTFWGDSYVNNWYKLDNLDYIKKAKYHQFKINISTNDLTNSPIIREIRIPYALKISDCLSYSTTYIDLYKDDLEFLDAGDYNLNINCIWKNNG